MAERAFQTVEAFDVRLKVEHVGEFFEASARLIDSSPHGLADVLLGETNKCPSRNRALALSHALVELATMIERGAIKIPS